MKKAHLQSQCSKKWHFTRATVPFKIPILEMLMVIVGVSLSGKTDVFFIDLQKTKADQNCYIDLLKTSLLPECRRLYPGNDFDSCKTVFRHTLQSDAAVSMTEHSRLRS